MAPTKKSRSVNKRFSYMNEVSPNKDGETAKKSIQRKRKLSDLLGLQWSKKELQDFYRAYRLYGKDWKKVAATVRNRSVEMVETLYTMNRAYLSLPEGTASVTGLIAMMTDHYCNLDGSASEQESNDGTGTSRKSQKRPRGNYRSNTSKESDGRFFSHSRTVASSSGCLSLLKKMPSGGTRPWAVGKRTPRLPVSYDKVNGERFFSPARQGLKLKLDANDDDVAHEVALALAEASQKGGSPQVPQTPNRTTHAELQLTIAKFVGSVLGDDGFEGSLGSIEADNGDISKDKSYLREEARKGRRLYGRKLQVDDNENNQLDDIKEACSGTEEGQELSAVRGKPDIGVTDEKVARSSSETPRKKSKKVLFRRDESSAFDALQALADLSLMMPETTNENESLVQVKEENDDLAVQSGLPEAMPTNHQRDRPTNLVVYAKEEHFTPGFEVATLKTSKLGKNSALDVTDNPKAKPVPHSSIAKMPRKRCKTLASNIPESEALDTHLSASPETEAKDIGKKLMIKGKRSQQKQGKSVKNTENSSPHTDPRREGDDSTVSTMPVPVKNHANLTSKVKSRRKMDRQKPQNLKDLKSYDKTLTDQINVPSSSIHDRSVNLKEKLYNCMSNDRVRRWCAFEWFYSAVDYPWFARREFVEYLNHVGLGHVPRLTRVEWGVIRSSLGKPRRFSKQFLKEEVAKLNQYRNSVRTHYTDLRVGAREGLPTDLARPLSVGQRIIAIHPKTREIHDGSVLTVDHTRSRVQFDRPELGVEFVMDIDCMPSNPLENMPASLVKHTFSGEKFLENFIELRMNGRIKDHNLEGYMKFSPHENLANNDRPSHVSPPIYPITNLLNQETTNNQQASNSQPSFLAKIQAKEADVQALAELTLALDKKEALVSELRHMNEDVLEKQKDGDDTLKDSELFKKQYAAVLVQLNEANEQVSSALYCLRQRNTYQENFLLTWPRLMVDSGVILGSFNCSSIHTRDADSHVDETIEISRTKARTMVDAAMQVMSSLKERGNSSERIEEHIDYVSNRIPVDDSCMPAVRPSTPAYPVNGSSNSPDHLTSCTLDSLHARDSKLNNSSDRNEVQIPSDLITHCVATLLMIQKCTERQFPPADVAQILDSAVTSLQPCCSQNLPVYADIRKCMGIIKTQILALIPT